jgi:hypothetical protein
VKEAIPKNMKGIAVMFRIWNKFIFQLSDGFIESDLLERLQLTTVPASIRKIKGEG